ncbi:uncharacterized protein I303_107049 [Kwoniella dejecticola CBS 10117]|uniref:Secretion-regulating guanine nucleotide exchange factor n=1 Tax=Kwoniella dejecticola CBS 10117 TaxID=1296121 RepID=A0A1A5ZYL5_9TREE|nr:uncharacterized protein I303_06450 [Kwoniella dejecticola CBS 10117]OBR82893.1 hypothetical protein I303_06450 [Kwoniella dejecticola CBS 10117]
MPPRLLACGSNAASHLSINHPDDVSILTPTVYHPSLPVIPPESAILDLVSASAHSLLLIAPSNAQRANGSRNTLLGAGTNTFGQLGPRCALWDHVKPEPRWKSVSLLNSVEVEDKDSWEPVKIAATWTTSFVVYQRSKRNSTTNQSSSSSGLASSGLNGVDQQEGDESIEQIVISCGSNDFGESGSSQSPLTLNTPAEIPISHASQKPTIVDLGLRQGETVEMIRGGQRHVIVVIQDSKGKQRVMGWGASRKGELDAGTISSLLEVGPSASGSRSNGASSSKGKGKGKGKAISRPTSSSPITIDLPIPHGERIIDIALGASHSLALLSNGTVLGWGSNLKNQITDVHALQEIRGIAATWNGSYFLTRQNEVLAQGSNTHSQLLRPYCTQSSAEREKIDIPPGWTVERLVAGSEHLILHMKPKNGEEDGLWTGGWNEHGNLALMDQGDRDTLQRVEVGVKGRRIKGVWGGCASTWVWIDE